jgi:hypothetical protein
VERLKAEEVAPLPRPRTFPDRNAHARPDPAPQFLSGPTPHTDRPVSCIACWCLSVSCWFWCVILPLS